MQTQALIKLFLFLSATSHAAPLDGARGRKDLADVSVDLSPVSGLPVTNNKPEKLAARGTEDLVDISVGLSPISRLPVAGPPAVARRQDYGAAPATTTTGDEQEAEEPSYGDVQEPEDDDASDGETSEADYGSDDSDSDSDSDSGAESEAAGDDDDDEQEEGEEKEGGAEGADDQEKPDTVPVASGPSYGVGTPTTGPISSPPATHLVSGGNEKSTEGEAASAPSYGAEAEKTESADGESAPSYA